MKIPYAEKEALEARGEALGLDYDLLKDCISEGQQDAMMEIQQQIPWEKIAYKHFAQKKSPQKPTRDLDAAIQKLNDLIEYAKITGDLPSYKLLVEVKLQKQESHLNNIKGKLKAKVIAALGTTDATKTRADILATSTLVYFERYEPTEEDWNTINGFDLDYYAEDLEEAEQYDEDLQPREPIVRDF